MPRHFTRTEADALLPTVEPLLREIQDLRRRAAEVAEALATDRAKIAGNGHRPQQELARVQDELATLTAAIAEHAATIQTMDIEIKDLDTGLIDFPALRDGREIYLCWMLGEDRVRFWHPIESGFAGRQPLDD